MSVFISYSHKDTDFVERLSLQLIERNIVVWKDIWRTRAGDRLDEKIETAIADAAYFCVVLSNHALNSDWVRRELRAACRCESKRAKPVIVPLLLDDCEVPPDLRDRLSVDFRRDFESGLHEILKVVGQRYNVWDSGSADDGSPYFIKFGIEIGYSDERFCMRIDVVSFDLDSDACILSQFDFRGNEHFTREHFALDDDRGLVELVLRSCAEEFIRSPGRTVVGRSQAKRAQLTIDDGAGAHMEVQSRVKLLGHESRGVVLFNVGALFVQMCVASGIDVGDTDRPTPGEDIMTIDPPDEPDNGGDS